MPRWPHDDMESLITFYGDPRKASFTNNLVLVKPPWQMTYEGRPIKGVQIHRKCAASLKEVFDDIWNAVGENPKKLPSGAVKFSGSYNFRPVRGSSRLSCHAFGAAIDLDAEENPMNSRGDLGTMSDIVIDAFKAQGWYWGGDFRKRKDPMHFQAANEGVQVASLDDAVGIAEMPPMTDGHEIDEPGDFADRYIKQDRGGSAIETLSTVSNVVDTADTIVTKVKPLAKSRISIGAVGLGASSVATVAASAPPTLMDQFINIWKSPLWWLVVLNVSLTGYILYHYWADHGRGALQRKDNV